MTSQWSPPTPMMGAGEPPRFTAPLVFACLYAGAAFIFTAAGTSVANEAAIHPRGDSLGPVLMIPLVLFTFWIPIAFAISWWMWLVNGARFTGQPKWSAAKIASTLQARGPTVGWIGWRLLSVGVVLGPLFSGWLFFSETAIAGIRIVAFPYLLIVAAWSLSALQILLRVDKAAQPVWEASMRARGGLPMGWY